MLDQAPAVSAIRLLYQFMNSAMQNEIQAYTSNVMPMITTG